MFNLQRDRRHFNCGNLAERYFAKAKLAMYDTNTEQQYVTFSLFPFAIVMKLFQV